MQKRNAWSNIKYVLYGAAAVLYCCGERTTGCTVGWKKKSHHKGIAKCIYKYEYETFQSC